MALNCKSCEGTGIVRNPASYVCNQCGGGLCEDSEGQWPSGLTDATVSGGYSSFHLMDCTRYRFSLCEKCLRNFFTAFKIPPEVFCHIGGGIETYESDLDLYHHRLWEKAGGDIKRLLEGGCNWRENCQEPAIYRLMGLGGNLRSEARCEAHKWCSVGLCDRVAPFQMVPFLEAVTEEQQQAVSQAWGSGEKIPDEPELSEPD